MFQLLVLINISGADFLDALIGVHLGPRLLHLLLVAALAGRLPDAPPPDHTGDDLRQVPSLPVAGVAQGVREGEQHRRAGAELRQDGLLVHGGEAGCGALLGHTGQSHQAGDEARHRQRACRGKHGTVVCDMGVSCVVRKPFGDVQR